jgi:hypothetical protein
MLVVFRRSGVMLGAGENSGHDASRFALSWQAFG